MNKKWYFLGCWLGVQVAMAQSGTSTSEPVRYSLQACLDYAIQNNLTLRSSALTVENSRNTANQSQWLKYPSVNGGFNLNSFTGRNVDPFSNSIVTTAIGTNNLGVNASLPLFQGGEIKNTIQRNQLQVEVDQFNYEAQKNTISLQVIVAYLNILSAEDQIEVAKKQVEVTRLQYERTKKLVDAGSVPPTNLFDLDAQLANDELTLVNANNALENAKLTLKQSLNITDSRDIAIQRVDVPNPAIQPYPESAQEIYEKAIGYLPEIKAANRRLEVADRQLAIVRAGRLPRISMSTGWGTTFSTAAKRTIFGPESFQQVPVSATFEGQTIPFVLNLPQQNIIRENIPYFNQLGNNQNVNLGVNMQIPIFNGYGVKYRTQGAKIQIAQAQIQSESAQLTIRQNIDQAYITMLNASRRYQAIQSQVEALEKSFQAASSRLDAGASNIVDYNLAKTNLDRALLNLIQAKYDFVFRLKILDFYQNKPLNF